MEESLESSERSVKRVMSDTTPRNRLQTQDRNSTSRLRDDMTPRDATLFAGS
jgi:hypothetical protein